MKSKPVLFAALIVVCAVSIGAVRAETWAGNVLDVTYLYPFGSFTWLYPQQVVTVPGSGEFPDGVGYSVTATQITITNLGASSSFNSAIPNGLAFADASREQNILDVVLDPSSNWTVVPSWDENEVLLNFQGLTFPQGATATFDITFGTTTPEPSTWAMMLIGFGGLGLIGYRQREKLLGAASV
jgi:hypothetical protein